MTEVPHCGRGPAGIVDLVRADEWVRPRGGDMVRKWEQQWPSSSQFHNPLFPGRILFISLSLSLNRDKLSVKYILWGPMTETFI